MKVIGIQLTPSELQAHREGRLTTLVRVAEEVTVCDACGEAACWEGRACCEHYRTAGTKTGYRNPLGEAGDVLMYSYTPPPCRQVVDIRLPRTDDPRFVQLWDVYAEERRAQTQGCAWPMGEYEKRMDAACEWDANNPDAPWSSNPVVVVGGVK